MSQGHIAAPAPPSLIDALAMGTTRTTLRATADAASSWFSNCRSRRRAAEPIAAPAPSESPTAVAVDAPAAPAAVDLAAVSALAQQRHRWISQRRAPSTPEQPDAASSHAITIPSPSSSALAPPLAGGAQSAASLDAAACDAHRASPAAEHYFAPPPPPSATSLTSSAALSALSLGGAPEAIASPAVNPSAAFLPPFRDSPVAPQLLTPLSIDSARIGSPAGSLVYLAPIGSRALGECTELGNVDARAHPDPSSSQSHEPASSSAACAPTTTTSADDDDDIAEATRYVDAGLYFSDDDTDDDNADAAADDDDAFTPAAALSSPPSRYEDDGDEPDAEALESPADIRAWLANIKGNPFAPIAHCPAPASSRPILRPQLLAASPTRVAARAAFAESDASRRLPWSAARPAPVQPDVRRPPVSRPLPQRAAAIFAPPSPSPPSPSPIPSPTPPPRSPPPYAAMRAQSPLAAARSHPPGGVRSEPEIVTVSPIALHAGSTAIATPQCRKAKSGYVTSWVLDTGATANIMGTRIPLLNEHFDPHLTVRGVGSVTTGAHVGGLVVTVVKTGQTLTLHRVIYNAKFAMNLISVPCLMRSAYRLVMEGPTATILTPDGTPLLIATLSSTDQLYHVEFAHAVTTSRPASSLALATDIIDKQRVWHGRCGHPSASTMKILLGAGVTSGMEGLKPHAEFCSSCRLGKSHRATIAQFRPAQYSARHVLEIIHADIQGPHTDSIGNSRYMLLLVDEYSRYVTVVPLLTKSGAEVHEFFEPWLARQQNRTGRKLQKFHSDNGGEFVNHLMKATLASNGSTFELTQPYTPQRNGIVERMNRTITDSARAMMQACGAPIEMWSYAATCAGDTRNCCTVHSPADGSLPRTPRALWMQRPIYDDDAAINAMEVDGEEPVLPPVTLLSLEHLRTFGCDAYLHIPSVHQENKHDARANVGIFVGYTASREDQIHSYQVFLNGRIHDSVDVQFNELSFAAMHALAASLDQPQPLATAPHVLHQYALEVNRNNAAHYQDDDMDIGIMESRHLNHRAPPSSPPAPSSPRSPPLSHPSSPLADAINDFDAINTFPLDIDTEIVDPPPSPPSSLAPDDAAPAPPASSSLITSNPPPTDQRKLIANSLAQSALRYTRNTAVLAPSPESMDDAAPDTRRKQTDRDTTNDSIFDEYDDYRRNDLDDPNGTADTPPPSQPAHRIPTHVPRSAFTPAAASLRSQTTADLEAQFPPLPPIRTSAQRFYDTFRGRSTLTATPPSAHSHITPSSLAQLLSNPFAASRQLALNYHPVSPADSGRHVKLTNAHIDTPEAEEFSRLAAPVRQGTRVRHVTNRSNMLTGDDLRRAIDARSDLAHHIPHDRSDTDDDYSPTPRKHHALTACIAPTTIHALAMAISHSPTYTTKDWTHNTYYAYILHTHDEANAFETAQSPRSVRRNSAHTSTSSAHLRTIIHTPVSSFDINADCTCPSCSTIVSNVAHLAQCIEYAALLADSITYQAAPDPVTYLAAQRRPDCAGWMAAIAKELAAMDKHKTWTLVRRPSSDGRSRVIGCKWVFKTKYLKDGTVGRLKARIVAKGFHQKHGRDYFETFAPVLHYKTLRVIVSIVATLDYEFKQMDVPTAFLNAELLETIYMELPEGMDLPASCTGQRRDWVCKLVKSLYGIKQAPREWNLDLNSTILSIGYTRCVSDTCLYTKISRTGRAILVPIFVDDMFPACHTDDLAEMTEDMNIIRTKYSIPPMENADVILGMCVERNRKLRTLHLHQGPYIAKLLSSLRMDAATVMITPSTMKQNNVTNQSPLTPDEKDTFASVIGGLMYASLSTRPDISHATAMLARKLHQPTHDDMVAAKHILRYLNMAPTRGVTYGGIKYTTVVLGPSYCDADWAGDTTDRKSTSGFVIKLNGGSVSWASKKQSCVSLSSAESEYYAMGLAVQELLWLRTLLAEINFAQTDATILQCDNQPAVAVASDDQHHSRTKHIDIKHHFLRAHIIARNIALRWVPTAHNQADIFTKSLVGTKFHPLANAVMGNSRTR